MIIDNSFSQGTPEWIMARLGVVTASCFGDVVTGSTCKPAAGQKAYAYRLAAEAITGEPLDAYKSLEMFMGNSLENEARAAYQLLTGNQVDQVGMIFMDENRRVGASPDGLITSPYIDYPPRGGVEIKNVNGNTQVEYLYNGGIPAKYRPQVYGSLYVSGLEWWDFISCSPGLPPHLVRVENTDKDYLAYADALSENLPKFLAMLDDIIERCKS